MAFSALRVGDRVHVKGTKQNGAVLATEIMVQNQDQQPQTEVEGVVAGLAGTCPGLTFAVRATPVVTDGSTFFKDGSCASLRNGAEVEVKGQRRADGTLVASQIETENNEDDKNDENNDIEIRGPA